MNQQPKKNFKKYQSNGQDIETKWYQLHEEHNTNEFKDIKDSELTTLQQLCRSAFSDEILKLTKSKLNLTNLVTILAHSSFNFRQSI